MRRVPTDLNEDHPDFGSLERIRDGILRRTGGMDGLNQNLPLLIKNAIDFVIDPVLTGRTKVSDLDNVEKTFIGLKIEHHIRDWLDVPKGIRDLVIDGVDVDVKNTVRTTWMIPPETYRTEDPCLLIASAESDQFCWLGLMLARDAYLNKPNRDGKRSVSAFGLKHIMWLVEGVPFPPSRWDGVDMARFRELRKLHGGARRAANFFRENVGRKAHRSIIQALLFDQLDPMKRLRENGGARDLLKPEGITILSGVYDADAAMQLGYELERDEFVAVQVP